MSQKVIGLSGDEAVAYAVKQCNVDVVAAYPITPQTIIVERIADYVNDGEVDLEYIPVESEHSAMSACIGAAAAGARAFTATAANGLALMHEVVYIASSLRLPIVMAIVNRALSGPICIHCDHSDTMAERDSSWIQLYVEDAQEAYDTVIQAFRIAEDPSVLLPVMVNLDGFIVSHTLQDVSVLPDEVVSEFVGKRQVASIDVAGKTVPMMLHPDNPLTFGPLDLFDYYFEHKRQQEEAIKAARDVIKRVNDEYYKISGRRYGDGMVDSYRMDDADIAVVGLGSTMGTVKEVVDEERSRGLKVGAIRIRSFRPFPVDQLLEELSRVKVVGVLDRSGAYGAPGAPVYNEIRSLLYDLDKRPAVLGYIYGIGGRDMPPELVKSVIRDLENALEKPPETKVEFIGVRE